MNSFLDFVQWPAMAVTVIAAWHVSAQGKQDRGLGFWCFLASNALWIIWGVYAHAYALIVLQICLATTNVRGALKNDAL
jgi:hypothetical protein